MLHERKKKARSIVDGVIEEKKMLVSTFEELKVIGIMKIF